MKTTLLSPISLTLKALSGFQSGRDVLITAYTLMGLLVKKSPANRNSTVSTAPEILIFWPSFSVNTRNECWILCEFQSKGLSRKLMSQRIRQAS